MLGWKVGQIATHLGLTEDNVSVSIHRLLAKLRQQWAEGQSGEPSFSDPLEKIP
jgi:DNA-directed RNA polymerase specialized sigma24 family protein